ncbi:hypothetical protein LTR66_014050 [Elasticomyces elasticus]|nr:hypothetical protein LTR66_014050 [Elasticomyces elasticus]
MAPSLVKRAMNPTYVPCVGCAAPTSFNNNFFITLFALIGAAMVAASIWFFFWAKNGGFHFRKGDWEDYKSTVLRRKGPDGKTLSNATKSTKLGGGSVVHGQGKPKKNKAAKKGKKNKLDEEKSVGYTASDGYTDITYTAAEEMSEVASEGERSHHAHRYRDRDVHEYRAEKPARVGGINRPADGSHFDYSNTDRSEIMTEISDRPLIDKKDKKSAKAEKKAAEERKRQEQKWKKEVERRAKETARSKSANDIEQPKTRREKKTDTPSSSCDALLSHPSPAKHRRDSRSASPRKRTQPSAAYSFVTGQQDDVSTTYTGTNTQTNTTSQRSASYYNEYRPHATPPHNAHTPHERNRSRDYSPRKSRRYVETETSSDTGTKVYSHHIPGVSKEKPKERGGRDVMSGYRRGMGGFGEDSDGD